MTTFYSQIPDELLELTDRQAVERYADGRNLRREALGPLSTAQLNAIPVAGTWSIQQIIFHLMDTDLIAAYQMKQILVQSRPALAPHDHRAMASRLPYMKLDPGVACELFRMNRLVMADLLRRVPDEAFDRVGIHPEAGEMTLARLVRYCIHHRDHHLRFIREKRQIVLKRPVEH